MGVIEAYRRRKSLSLRELAEMVGGTTATSLSRIDRGEQQPSADLLRRIAAATDGELTPNLILGIEASLSPVAEAAS